MRVLQFLGNLSRTWKGGRQAVTERSDVTACSFYRMKNLAFIFRRKYTVLTNTNPWLGSIWHIKPEPFTALTTRHRVTIKQQQLITQWPLSRHSEIPRHFPDMFQIPDISRSSRQVLMQSLPVTACSHVPVMNFSSSPPWQLRDFSLHRLHAMQIPHIVVSIHGCTR